MIQSPIEIETGKKPTKQDRQNMKNYITYEEQDDELPGGYSEIFHIRRLGGHFLWIKILNFHSFGGFQKM